MTQFQREIIYLHGLGSSPQSAKRHLIGEAFKDNRSTSIIAPDLNVPSFERLSVNKALECAMSGILALSSGRRVIIGSSFGAFLALHALHRLSGKYDPDRFVLVLLAPALDPWDPRSRLLTPDLEREWLAKGRYPLMYYPQETCVPVHSGFVQELRSVSKNPILPPPIPTLIIHGDRDEVVSIAQSEEFARRSPRTIQLDTINDGHELLSHPSLLIERIRNFIDTH